MNIHNKTAAAMDSTIRNGSGISKAVAAEAYRNPIDIANYNTTAKATPYPFVPLANAVNEALVRAVICRDGVSRRVAEKVVEVVAKGRSQP
jgi:hypothetical protein